MLKIRPSGSDRALKCSGSILAGDYPVDAKSDEARDGHAKHEIAARLVSGTLTHGDFVRFGDYYNVDPDELEKAAMYAKSAWDEIKGFYPNAKTEQKLIGVASDGTVDVCSLEGAALADWKFGHSYDEHPKQLLSYADGILVALNEKMPECGYIRAYEIWVRHKEYREYKFTKEAIHGHRAAMLEQIKNAGKQYNPGSHCNFCPRVNDCEARLQYVKTTTNMFMEVSKGESLWGRDDLGGVYDRVAMMRKALDKYDELLREYLKDGPIRIDNERVIELCTQKTTTIFADKAWNVLTKQYGYNKDDMAKCLSIKKEQMEKIIKERANKGNKSKAVKELMDSLAEAGAVWEGTKDVRRVKAIS